MGSGSSADSSTATPPRRRVSPPPTVRAGPRNPGNATVSPPTLMRGSSASITWMMRADSPGETTSIRTAAMACPSPARRASSSGSTVSVPHESAVRLPNSIVFTVNVSSLSFTGASPR